MYKLPTVLAFMGLLFCSYAGAADLMRRPVNEDWQNLLGDETLSAWQNAEEPGVDVKINRGAFAIKTEKKRLLKSKLELTHFLLEAEVKLPSGPKVRSGLYFGGRDGKSTSVDTLLNKTKVKFKSNNWNRIRIHAVDGYVKIWVNDKLATDLSDATAVKGYVGMQPHDGGADYQLRQLRVKNLAGKLDVATLQEGKRLYNAAGSCVACHMPDGSGQLGMIPPLAGSEWLMGHPDRTIAIVLRGLAGPIKVNNLRYHGSMPPQLLFDDQELASIITYVNNAWGNEGAIVTADHLAKLRQDLPMAVYTPEALLKAFPFDKSREKRNGTYELDYDDQLTDVKEPVVYRTFMPGASPAAFAVALPGNQFYCWDAGESRLRYVWKKGGFIRGNQVHWSSNGKPVAQFVGQPYYLAKSSLIENHDFALLSKTDYDRPIYDTTQAKDFPFSIGGSHAPPRFKGLRKVDGYPEFRYLQNGVEIRELIKATEDGHGIVRSFAVDGDKPVVLSLTPSDHATFSSSAGVIQADGRLELSATEAKSFTVTIVEKNPAPLGAASGGTK